MSDLPAVQFESQSQLFVINDHVSSHMLLCPDTVGQSLFQPGQTDAQRCTVLNENKCCFTGYVSDFLLQAQ